jgi:RHS repeat-associated protein
MGVRLMMRSTMLAFVVGLTVGVISPADLAHAASSTGAQAFREALFEPSAPILALNQLTFQPSKGLRLASRTAYRDLLAAEARSSVRASFSELVEQPAWRPVRPRGDERITGYPATNVAQLDRGDGKRAVILSTVPLTTIASDGRRVPLDLSLQTGSSDLVPAHPLVPLRIPRNLRDGIKLSDDLWFTPVDGESKPLLGALGTQEGSTAFFANTQTDADTLVKPVPRGFETHTILRSPESPERLYFEVSSSTPFALLDRRDGSIAIRGPSGDVATVLPPLAHDAAGAPVPVTMHALARTLVLEVDHRASAYLYPIAVDPTVTDNGAIGTFAEEGWWYSLESGFSTWSSESRLAAGYTNSYGPGWWSSWLYETQGVSRIYRFDSTTSSTYNSGVQNQVGIVDGDTGTWTASQVMGFTYGPTSATICPTAGCPSTDGTGSDTAVFYQSSITSGYTFFSYLEAATIHIAQDTGPSVRFNTTDPTIGINRTPNALLPNTWARGPGAFAIDFTMSDPGIGVWEYGVRARNGTNSITQLSYRRATGCIGVQCEQSRRQTTFTSGLPDGDNLVEVTVANATGASTVGRAHVYVDNQAPRISVTGMPAGNALGEGDTRLQITATDGTAPVMSSGLSLNGIVTSIDDTQVLRPDGSRCSPGPCELRRSYTIRGRDWGPGQHTLTIRSTDVAGGTSTSTIPFTISGAPSVPVGPGQVSLANGTYTLATTDVAIGGLGVNRAYDSRQLQDADEPLGPGWQMSLGGWQNLVRLASGGAVLIDASGRALTFAADGRGGFLAPPGYQGLTLAYTESPDAFTLTDARGSVTTLTQPGGRGGLYVPTSSAGPNGTDVTTFTFGEVDGAMVPLQALAPVPAGVRCETLVRGCKALTFDYATSTTASSRAPAGWGNVRGQLRAVVFQAWDPATRGMSSTEVANYSYDVDGRLRAVWDPRISPVLKLTYGYDSTGRVTALAPPGQQPWVFSYASTAGDIGSNWLVSVSRPGASTPLGANVAPQNTAAGALSNKSARVGTAMKTWDGSWTNEPVIFSYQWESCEADGTRCVPIAGATSQSYTPVQADVGHRLRAMVTATNNGGSTSAPSVLSERVWTTLLPAYSSQFGSSGSGSGQLSAPNGTAVDPSGNVWVVDSNNGRIQKFSANGTYLTTYGEEALSFPTAIAIDQSTGNVYVTDTESSSVVQFDSRGAFLRSFGSYGFGGGLFMYPEAITIDSARNLWVGDGFGYVQRFTLAGAYVSQFSIGWAAISGITTSGGNVYVVDQTNLRVRAFSTTGTYLREVSRYGYNDGEFTSLASIATDSATGNLYLTGSGKVMVFSNAGTFLGSFGGTGSSGGWLNGAGLSIDSTGNIYLADFYADNVEKWVLSSTQNNPPAPPASTATWTIRYHVPISGTGAPYTMSSTTVARWDQRDVPTDATEIFPPDQIPANPATDHRRAAVYYLDAQSRNVNIAAPGGRITTKEYNANNNIIRTLSAANRQTALNAGAISAETAQVLDTELGYGSGGVDLQTVIGPRHTVELSNGSTVQARQITQYVYDEGAPPGGPYHLMTSERESARIEGEPSYADTRNTRYSYSGQSNLGWRLHAPTSVRVDSLGLNLTTTTMYDAITGNVTETRSPAGPGGGDANSIRTAYYTAGSNAIAACGNHPEWADLPCQTKYAGTQTNLPVTTVTYNLWGEADTATETAGEATRTQRTTYDNAGRPLRSSVESSVGSPVPATTIGYDATTGMPTTQADGTHTITRTFDTLGQLTRYVDGDGNTSTYTYDILGRTRTIDDGKGRQTITYGTTGDISTLTDSAAGSFRATYDLDGALTTQTYPNGMDATTTYDSTGARTALRYVKTTNCTTNCTWLTDEIKPSIHGQWLTRNGSLSDQNYIYDGAGRLTQVQDTPTGQGCTTRIYTWDADSNRTSMTTRTPNEDLSCASSGGTTETHSFSAADRLIDTGVTYTWFGNISALPAELAGGTATTASYYSDDTLASTTQGTTRLNYSLDPAGRDRLISATTERGTAETIAHFADESDSPAWTSDGTNWSRNIPGIDGGLAAVHDSTGSPVLQLANLHGDIVATASLDARATALLSTEDTTEFGVPRTEAPPRYNWLGSAQRPTELPSGLINMGARGYVPQLGQFTQPDPVSGGSATPYGYTFGDPVNSSDPSGAATHRPRPGIMWALENPPNIPEPEPTVEEEAVYDTVSFVGGGGDGGGASISRFGQFTVGPCTFNLHGRTGWMRPGVSGAIAAGSFRCSEVVSVSIWLINNRNPGPHSSFRNTRGERLSLVNAYLGRPSPGRTCISISWGNHWLPAVCRRNTGIYL